MNCKHTDDLQPVSLKDRPSGPYNIQSKCDQNDQIKDTDRYNRFFRFVFESDFFCKEAEEIHLSPHPFAYDSLCS